MTNKIIVIRHGETEADKTNPTRKLTPLGISQINMAAKKIEKEVKGKIALIVCNNTFRTIQSAQILSRNLGLKFIVAKANLRIKVVDGKEVPSRINMARRFLWVVKKYNYANILIIVGNGGALESFINYQTIYKPSRKISRELKYAEFVILKRKV